MIVSIVTSTLNAESDGLLYLETVSESCLAQEHGSIQPVVIWCQSQYHRPRVLRRLYCYRLETHDEPFHPRHVALSAPRTVYVLREPDCEGLLVSSDDQLPC